MSRHDFAAMRAAVRSGNAVQVVSAPQLFPTPPDVARRMVELLELDAWQGEAWETLRVLEPSAGTGNLIAAVLESWPEAGVTAWELNYNLAKALRAKYPEMQIANGDFLEALPPLELYDAVIMNPPFERGAWEKHLRKAWDMVRPGGRLVTVLPHAPGATATCISISISGNCQTEELPDNTFAGTGVRTFLALLEKGVK